MELLSNDTANDTFVPDGSMEDFSRPTILLVLELTSLFIIMISAFAANVTAIFIILRVRILRRTPHNLLILTLSLGDLGVVFTSMPFSVVSSLDGGEFLRTHHGVCTFNGFCVLLFSLVNFLTIVAIAMDRVFIVTSAKVLQTHGRLRVGIMIVFLWSLSVAVALLPVTEIVSTMIYVHYTRHCTYKDDEEEDERFRIAMRVIIIGFVLPALTVCYSIIAYFLWKQKQKLRALQQAGRTQRGEMKKTKRTDGVKMASSTTTTTDASGQSVSDPSMADSASVVTIRTNTTYINQDKVVPEASWSSTSPSDQKGESGTDVASDGNRCRSGIQEERVQAPSTTDSAPMADERGRNKAVDTASTVKREKKNFEVQKRVALIGFLLVLSQVICWGPFFLVRAMSADVPESVGVFTMWSAYCVNVINPLIYAFMNRRARKELVTFKDTIRKKMQCTGNPR
ncbi:alpha-2 adrenergic receptor [Strongylocentrotus purpuratus]|uniref:G-protein coupled receptors family 1 profile domain-containing protein n=1 Tax=Strongylocentrotus purpuratus TaxID=7668 RepID=A0A7M7T162_STRPU|nr:alpha-2 adrenergic receptor [Strongylocentrotus purpuratus]